MRGFVTVDEPAAFDAWMAEQVAAAQSSEDDIWN
jgi:hypothetical protein